MDPCRILYRPVVTLDEDRQRQDLLRVERIQLHPPDPSVRRLARCNGAGRAAAGVGDVDDVRHPGPFVVREVLDADELEHAVEVTPVLQNPLWTIDGDALGVTLPTAVVRRQWVPLVGGHQLGPVSIAAGGNVPVNLDEVPVIDCVEPGAKSLYSSKPGVSDTNAHRSPWSLSSALRARRDVRVELRLRRVVRERVVAGQHDGMAVARHCELVLVVEATHPPDRP